MTQGSSDELVGLDIGSDSLKLLKINSTQTPYKIENFSVFPLPAGAIVKGDIKDFAIVSQTLREMIKHCEIPIKNVALAIPRSSTIIKNITVDRRLNADDIESRAWVEANRHFPDLVGDIYLDFSVLGTSVQDESQLELVIVACRKEQIKPYVELMRMAGLVAKIVDVNSYALERALAIVARTFEQKQTIALLNLDFNLSTFIVEQNNNLIYAHDQTFDGYRLINQVSAEDEAKHNELLKETLSAHLRHTMHFFYSSRPNVTVEQIILSGDCAMTPNLALFIRQEVGIDTVFANPFASMTIGPTLDEKELKKHAPILMLCCGLALSKVKSL